MFQNKSTTKTIDKPKEDELFEIEQQTEEPTTKKKRKKVVARRRQDEFGQNNDIFTPLWLAKELWKFGIDCLGRKQTETERERHSNYHDWTCKPNLKKLSILEPSCGTGNMLQSIPENLHSNITAIEINSTYCQICKVRFPNVTVIYNNYLTWKTNKQFDIIIMNPPFSESSANSGTSQFIDKSIELLSDDGVLVTLAPNYLLDNSDRRKRKYSTQLYDLKILPTAVFDTDGDGKLNRLQLFALCFVKKCNNEFFIFEEDDNNLFE
jgi:phospholipid N-methyltransferase